MPFIKEALVFGRLIWVADGEEGPFAVPFMLSAAPFGASFIRAAGVPFVIAAVPFSVGYDSLGGDGSV